MRIFKGIAVSYSIRRSESNRRLMGKGYNRLIAWEGEKTMTFQVTDALMSPMGMAVLSGAGLINASKDHSVHVHTTMTVALTAGAGKFTYAELADEIGVTDGGKIFICKDAKTPIYATAIDGSNDIVNWFDYDAVTIKSFQKDDTDITGTSTEVPVEKDGYVTVTVTGATNETVNLDMYVEMNAGASEIEIKPSDFGGYFYVEADTLFRREDTGVDMAATLTFPRVKVQSGFTFTMAASGDPSTFDFVMDAFPGYTRFDSTKKVNMVMSIISGSGNEDDSDFHAAQNIHKDQD